MKEYQRKGILADAYLRGEGLVDPEYVSEYAQELKPSRNIRQINNQKAERERMRYRKDYDLDD